MTIESWTTINDAGECPHQNLPLAKGFDPRRTWNVFYRVYRNSRAWGKFMLILRFERSGQQDCICLAMKKLSIASYCAIMAASGEWRSPESRAHFDTVQSKSLDFEVSFLYRSEVSNLNTLRRANERRTASGRNYQTGR